MRRDLLVMLMAGNAGAQDGGLTLDALATSARGRLGPEWKVEGTSAALQLSRTVSLETADSPAAVAQPATFSFVLTIGATVSPAQRLALMKRNDSIRARLDALHRLMRAFECDEQRQAWTEGGCFNPRTESERKQVRHVRALERQLAESPAYHLGDFRSVSLEALVNGERRRWFHVVRCSDCDTVEKLLRSFLAAY
jgi:hypothetical protein